MAISLVTFRPNVIRVGALPESNRRKSWWAPLFGWSSEPDYLLPKNRPERVKDDETNKESGSDPSGQPTGRARTRLPAGGFTAEKAWRLRMLTADTASFHDVMYHSAIASRLASDFKHRPEFDSDSDSESESESESDP